jgi:hypothetical protein
MKIITNRFSFYHVNVPFQFPWIHYEKIDGALYFETVLFYRCFNFDFKKPR